MGTVEPTASLPGSRGPSADASPVWLVAILCIIAVAIAFFIRLPWIDWASGVESMQWQGQVQPVTYDAYYHGSAIRQHVEGRLVGAADVSGLVSSHSLVQWPGMLARWLLPVSTSTVLLWMPVVLAGLLAIPVLLIGRALGSTWWGFGAAVLSVVAVNYYERTMAGYYDHDMLSLTWITMIAWLLIEADRRESMNWLLAGAMAMIFFPLLYGAGKVIAIGVGLAWIIQRLVRYPRSAFTRSSTIFVALAVAVVPFSSGDQLAARPLPWLAAIAALLLAFCLLRRSPSLRLYAAAVCGSLLLAAFAFPWAELWWKVLGYARGLDAGPMSAGRYAEISYRELHMVSILESQLISMGDLGHRLLGSGWIACIGIIGFLVACIRRPLLLCLLPMAAVAAFSLTGGLRFITWGTVPAAFGASYLAFAIPRYFMDRSGKSRPAPWATCAGVLLSLALAIPSILHAMRFSPHSTYSLDEIKVIASLEEVTAPGDLAIAWWDYGSGIWYYGNCDVLVHPGRHTNDFFAISHVLLGDAPAETAALATSLAGWRANGHRVAIHKALRDAEYPGEQGLAEAMRRITSGERKPPRHDGRTFLYLPLDQVQFMETIWGFGKPKLMEDGDGSQPFVRWLYGLRIQDDRYLFHPGNGLVFDRDTGATGFTGEDGRVTPMAFASVHLVEQDEQDGSVHIRRAPMPVQERERWATLDRSTAGISVELTPPAPGDELHLFIIPDVDAMLLLDNKAHGTNMIQMGLLGAYNPKYFRPVSGNLAARVYEVLPLTPSIDEVE